MGTNEAPATSRADVVPQSILPPPPLPRQVRAGSGWLFAIAAFTLLNSIAWVAGLNVRMLVGLGAVLFAVAASWGAGGVGAAATAGATAAGAGLFAALGFLGRKGNRTALVVGLIIYVLDGIVVLVLHDWLGAAFHVVAALGMAGALRAPQVDQGAPVPSADDVVLASGRSSRVLRQMVGYLALVLGAAVGLPLIVLGAGLVISESGSADPSLVAGGFLIFLGIAFAGLLGYIGFRMLSSAKNADAPRRDAA